MILALALACGGAALEGRVTDPAGSPLEGASVTIVGTRCQGRADAEGRFSVPCAPGPWTVSIGQTGFVSERLEIDGGDEAARDVGTAALMPIPEGEGLFLLRGATLERPPKGRLVRTTKGPADAPTETHFCLETESSPEVRVPAGEVVLFDKAAPDWRAWPLDAEGCAYRKHRVDTRWEQLYGEALQPRIVDVGPEQRVVTLTLAPGGYFVADWPSGYFRELKGEHPDPRGRYAGFYLVAEAE